MFFEPSNRQINFFFFNLLLYSPNWFTAHLNLKWNLLLNMVKVTKKSFRFNNGEFTDCFSEGLACCWLCRFCKLFSQDKFKNSWAEHIRMKQNSRIWKLQLLLLNTLFLNSSKNADMTWRTGACAHRPAIKNTQTEHNVSCVNAHFDC